MSDSLLILLVGVASLAIISIAISYLFAAVRRKKDKCPQCGARTMAAAATYTDEVTGQKIPGEPDVPFALVSAVARAAIGIIALGYVFIRLFGALGYDSCDLQGISMVCKYDDPTRPGTIINLVYSLLALVGGVIVIFNGGTLFSRALKSRGKAMTYEFVCAKDHHWTQQANQIEK
jgi:hypothetical protein